MFFALDMTDERGPVYLTNGIESRWVPDEQTLADLAYLGQQGLLPIVGPADYADESTVVNGVRVRKIGNRSILGNIISEPPKEEKK